MFIPTLSGDKRPSELKRKSELQSEQLTADAAYSAYQRKNYRTALKISLPFAEHRDPSAQHNIGMMYYDGKGVRQNYSEALKWLHKAAQQGLASAEYNIGLMYDIGQGVPQDYLEALKWYRKATEQGNANTLTSVGMMHYSGKGVTKDYSEALQWYRRLLNREMELPKTISAICTEREGALARMMFEHTYRFISLPNKAKS